VIAPELRAEIRRLFFAEHFAVNTIAEALGVHHETVKGAIGSHKFVATPAVRKSQLDPYMPFIRETIERYPKLRSTRLFLMLEDRGYEGSVQQLRRVVRKLRPLSLPAFLALTTMPGEQAQCDWGSFGTLQVGRAIRKLSCFVMVLRYSRRIYARFTFDQTTGTFLRCHVEAFRAFRGVPRVVLYDNLKTAVLERVGDAIRFHPDLLELAGHYHFRPQPCNVAAGWEEGGVERAIGYFRTSFAEARTYRDLDDANAQLRRWLEGVANVRPWPDDRRRTVDEVWQEEIPRLIPLPEHDADTRHIQVIRSGKQPYVRFDLNDYSIPHTLVRQPLTLVADEDTVLVLNGTDEVARHVRSYDRGRRIEDPAHLDGLLAERRRALPSKTQDRLRAAVPEIDRLYEMLALRGENIGTNVAQLASLLSIYGLDDFRAAVHEAAARETPRASSVGNILERLRRARNAPPVLPVQLPDNPRVRGLRVVSHDPATCDALRTTTDPGRSDDDR
jgi:transposase